MLTHVHDVFIRSQLKHMHHFDASQNKIEGPVPLGLVSLISLNTLRLEHNHLTGVSPAPKRQPFRLSVFLLLSFCFCNRFPTLHSSPASSRHRQPYSLVFFSFLSTALNFSSLWKVVPDVVSRLQSLSLIDFEHNPGLLLRPATLAWMRTNLKHRTVAKI